MRHTHRKGNSECMSRKASRAPLPTSTGHTDPRVVLRNPVTKPKPCRATQAGLPFARTRTQQGVLTFSQLLLQHLQLLLGLGQGDRGRLTAAKGARASGAEAGWSRGQRGLGQAAQAGGKGRMKAWKQKVREKVDTSLARRGETGAGSTRRGCCPRPAVSVGRGRPSTLDGLRGSTATAQGERGCPRGWPG